MTRSIPALVLASIALLAGAAPAATPGQVNYQGLLLDDQGAPVTGNVDLVFAIFTAPAGGSSLWSETHPDVAVLDGVYDVRLGATTPITPAVVVGGSLYLEIEVEGETLTPRQRLVAVPYAIHADTAGVAENLGGYESAYFTQIIQHVSFDGVQPPNDDPREGVDDPDGDTLANFVDPDNDNDDFDDAAELARGSDINLVTPTITDIEPDTGGALVTTQVTITGTHFEPGIAVSFGSQNPTPQNVTATSFVVVVGPQPVGVVAVEVTRTNGESASTTFEFVPIPRRTVFVTSVTYDGNLGGLAGADAECAARAAAASLPGTYRAWLGDATGSPNTRFTQTFAYYRTDDVAVADNYADLTDGTLDNAIDRDEFAALRTGVGVWTNAGPSGGAQDQSCLNWSSDANGQTGRRGTAGLSNSFWTAQLSGTCDVVQRLYCFEQ